MERIVSICFVLLFSIVSLTANAQNVSSTHTPSDNQIPTEGIYFVNKTLESEGGGIDGGICMKGKEGIMEYYYYRDTHKLIFTSYNKKNGKLILREYNSNGTYTGKFSGTYKKILSEDGRILEEYSGKYKSWPPGFRRKFHFIGGY